MEQHSYVISEFPDDAQTIQRLRPVNSVFDEICEDLELLGRDLARFSEEDRLMNQGEYLDARESYQALCQELAEILRRESNIGE